MKRDEITMIEKIKVSRSKVEILWLCLLLGIFFAVMVVLGGLQYIVCLDAKPDITMSDCFSWRKK